MLAGVVAVLRDILSWVFTARPFMSVVLVPEVVTVAMMA